MKTDSKYDYSVGDWVETVQPLRDENDVNIPVGSLLRIVAIAPKVRKYPTWMLKMRPDLDNKDYFYNAVRIQQESDYGDRIRANFVTIKHYKNPNHK